MKFLLLSLCFLFSLNVESETAFYDDHARGWHWYELQNAFEIEKITSDLIGSKKNPAIEKLKKYQESIEEAKAAAVMNPTPQNVINYQQMQYEMLQVQ